MAARYSACCKARTGSNTPDPKAVGLATWALTGPLLVRQRASTKQRPFPYRRLCCPLGSTGTTAASDAHPASAHFPAWTGYRAPRFRQQHTAACRAEQGLPSSRRHSPNVPHPLRRGVPRGCPPGSSPLPWPSPWFSRLGSPLPHHTAGRSTARQVSRHATDRPVASPTGHLTLGFDAGRFPPTPPACYRASWQLPGPDFHRQATASLRLMINPTSDRPPASWAHRTVHTAGAARRCRR